MNKKVRVIRNRGPIGAPWLIVAGDFYCWDRLVTGRPRWSTEFQIAEHHDKITAIRHAIQVAMSGSYSFWQEGDEKW